MMAIVACKQEAPTAVETTASGDDLAYYGEKIEWDKAMSSAELVKFMDGKKDETVKITTEIIETCPKKGCWMDVTMPGGESMKVRFKDYGFFVPTEGAEGKTAVMEGRAFIDTMEVDLLRHYAEDAGKSKEEIEAITEPEEVLAFEATGVIIKS